MPEVKVDDLANHLKKLKTEQGDEAYQQALQGFVKNLLAQGETGPFIVELLKSLEEELDLESLTTEADEIKKQRSSAQEAAQKMADSPDINQTMIEAMKKQMPNLKTQAQFDNAVRLFEVLQIYINAALGQDDEETARARDTLDQGLDLTAQLAVMAEQAAASPEVTSNPDFTEPPKQFTEQDSCEQFHKDLGAINSSEKLQQWYAANKTAFDRVTSKKLRDKLFDSIRAKKRNLSN